MEARYPDPDHLSNRLAFLIKRPALLMAPALGISAIMLMASDEIWTTRGSGGGRGPGMLFAHGTLVISAIGVGLYFLAPMSAHIRHFAMTPPTEVQKNFAVGFTRFLALAILYGWAFSMVSKFS